jgi:two-component system sensor histidine kinase BaeS
MIMQRAAEQPVMANAKLLKLREARIKAAKGVPTNEPEAILPPPKLPSDLFGPIPTDGGFADPVAQALFQVAQYRAALATVRCTAQSKPVEPALDMELSPYLSKAQLSDTACVRQAMDKVRKDGYWLGEQYTLLADCALSRAADPYQNCLSGAFEQAAATATAAAPVEVFFGAQHRSPIDQLGRPALLGVIALLAVAAVGTAWIARRVSRPVRLLTGASRQLAEGRLDVRVPAEGQDELARLSASFNKMAQALQRSEERQRRLIADVAHEMRTPLSNLRGYLEGLADGVIEPSPDLFTSLHEETLLQRRILDDLQVLALAEAGDLNYSPAPMDLAELAETTATAHRAVAANAGINLVVDARTPAPIIADPDRTRQVLSNLLSNAIRYTDAGGRVELRVERDALGVLLSVRDTGVGMTPEEVARAFDRFWRADPARQRATGGSGLGLTIARRIVADQGGSLEAESTPGLGTTFTVRLPSAV